MDAVIEIVLTDEEIGDIQAPRECSIDCNLWDEYNESCSAGWHKEVSEQVGLGWRPVPTEKCPGPGRYRLVRVEDVMNAKGAS